MKEGDIVCFKHSDTKYGVIKILQIDVFKDIPGGWPIYHNRLYEPLDHKPTVEDVPKLKTTMGCGPLDGNAAERDGEVVCNYPVTAEEREPFLCYLKDTNFRRYLAETNQTFAEVSAEAKRHYAEGCALNDAGRRAEAIEEYTKASDLMPTLWEAVDNRGFCRMEMGDFRTAIYDFQEAIHARRTTPPEEQKTRAFACAFFTVGECHLKLGELDMAEEIFKQCVERWPDQPQNQQFLDHTRKLKRKTTKSAAQPPPLPSAPPRAAPEKKPWWKVW